MSSLITCPLCDGQKIEPWHRDRRRDYLRCADCNLVFVPASFHLDAVAEKAIYDQHENDPGDAGYRRFLMRLTHRLLQRLPPQSTGLDFGCGPGPALAAMLREAGHSVALYDKFYFPDATVLQQQYDFICATEVLEHLPDPRAVLDSLFACLRPGGWLGVMTKRARDQAAFARWHYILDPTHICFFSDHTFGWIATHWGARLEMLGDDVVLLQKNDVTEQYGADVHR